MEAYAGKGQKEMRSGRGRGYRGWIQRKGGDRDRWTQGGDGGREGREGEILLV